MDAGNVFASKADFQIPPARIAASTAPYQTKRTCLNEQGASVGIYRPALMSQITYI